MTLFQIGTLIGTPVFLSALPLSLTATKKKAPSERRRFFCLSLAAITISTVPALLGSFYAQRHASYKVDTGVLTELGTRVQGKQLESVLVVQTEAGLGETFATQPLQGGAKVGDRVQVGYLQYAHSKELRDLQVLDGADQGWSLHIPDRSSQLLIAATILIFITLLLMTQPVQNFFLDKEEAVRRHRTTPAIVFDKFR